MAPRLAACVTGSPGATARRCRGTSRVRASPRRCHDGLSPGRFLADVTHLLILAPPAGFVQVAKKSWGNRAGLLSDAHLAAFTVENGDASMVAREEVETESTADLSGMFRPCPATRWRW